MGEHSGRHAERRNLLYVRGAWRDGELRLVHHGLCEVSGIEGDADLHEAHRLDSDLRSDAGGCDAARRLELDEQQRICGRRFDCCKEVHGEVHPGGHHQLQHGGGHRA